MHTSNNLCDLERRGELILKELLELASEGNLKNLGAEDVIYRLACKSVNSLGELSRSNPEKVAALARTCSVWPSFYSPLKYFSDMEFKRVEDLEVGKESLFKIARSPKQRKQWTLESKPVLKVFDLIREIESLRNCFRAFERERSIVNQERLNSISPIWLSMRDIILELKPFSKRTAPVWFEVIWAYVYSDSGGAPERKEYGMRSLGEYREEHTSNRQGEITSTDSNIRDGIKKRLREAVIRMAKSVQKLS